MFITSGKRHTKIVNPVTAATVAEARESFARGDETVTLSELFERCEPQAKAAEDLRMMYGQISEVDTA
jgi:hypothetical protein